MKLLTPKPDIHCHVSQKLLCKYQTYDLGCYYHGNDKQCVDTWTIPNLNNFGLQTQLRQMIQRFVSDVILF